MSFAQRHRWIWPLLIIMLGLGYRAVHLGTKPPRFATKDEFHYLWTGLHLLQGEGPVSWSELPVYEGSSRVRGDGRYHGMRFQIVSPAFDHPPLFSLLAAAFARLTGAAGNAMPLADSLKPYEVIDISLARARLFSLALAAVTMGLLFQIGRRLYDYATACGALALYAILAATAAQNNLLVPENLTTPLFLFSLLALHRYVSGEHHSRPRFASIMIATTAAATCAKVAAGVQVLPLVILLLLAGRRREALYPMAGTVLGLAAFLGYAAAFDWTWFLAVQNDQAARFAGLNPWRILLGIMPIMHSPSYSHLLLVGWLALFVHLASDRARPLMLAPLLYLMGYMFFADITAMFGWHFLPYYPFLCLALADQVRQIVDRPDPARWYAFVSIALLGAGQFVAQTYIEHRSVIRFGYILTVGLCLLAPMVRESGFRLIVRYTTLAILLLLAARELQILQRV